MTWQAFPVGLGNSPERGLSGTPVPVKTGNGVDVSILEILIDTGGIMSTVVDGVGHLPVGQTVFLESFLEPVQALE